MESFNYRYHGRPPWDVGHVQPEFARIVGCGTGENILYFANLDHEVWGIDSSQVAIEKAKAKAKERYLEARFRVMDALELEELGRDFDTVIDSGLFHTFEDEERPSFVQSLSSVLKPGGTYIMLAMSDLEPDDWGGPRRIAKEEIHATFHNGWRINYIQRARFETLLEFHIEGAKAWLSSITKL